MRLLALGSVAVLIATAVLAPHVRARGATVPSGALHETGESARREVEAWALAEALFDADPQERARKGEAGGMLGAALLGYLHWLEKSPDDLEAQRGAFRASIELSAAGLGHQGLEEQVILPRIKAYLENRARLDPDGSLLRETIRKWIDVRVDHDYWLVRAAMGMHLAGIGDERGFALLRGLALPNMPFYRDFFSYAMKWHPRFPGVRAMVEHYLPSANLGARVFAGAALLDYHGLFGEGRDLVEKYESVIRTAFQEAATNLVSGASARGEDVDRGHTALVGLAMLAGETDVALLRSISPMRSPEYAGTISAVRAWVGLDRPPDIVGGAFGDWQPPEQEYFFRAAAHRYARARRAIERAIKAEAYARAAEAAASSADARASAAADAARAAASRGEAEDEARFWHAYVEAAFHWPGTDVQLYAFRALAALDPSAKDLPRRIAHEGGVLSLFAGSMIDEDRVPILLPGLYVGEMFDYQALAAVHLWEQIR